MMLPHVTVIRSIRLYYPVEPNSASLFTVDREGTAAVNRTGKDKSRRTLQFYIILEIKKHIIIFVSPFK